MTGESMRAPASDGRDREFRMFPKSWGAEYVRDGEVIFRLWAPELEALQIRIGKVEHEMTRSRDGWFELLATGIAPNTPYLYVLPDGRAVPDPASRAQDGGITGPSLVTDPTAYPWKHPDWSGRPWEEAILYELHIGTFTEEGTFGAAIERLPHLAELGVTAIEIMPVGQFPGERGWGYDGVLLYTPHHAYGAPDDFKAFIDAAHGHGLMVFLDVVYNHFGPEGNYLPLYARSFFDANRNTPWGAAIDFFEKPVRDFFVENALYWLVEFNLDGLRIDAVHAIEDERSEIHILTELSRRVREECRGRKRHLVVEDSRNITRFFRDIDGSREIDAGWNDDFHHACHVLTTGETGGYFKPFAENPTAAIATALAEGYVMAGDPPVEIDGQKVSAPALVPPTAYVTFIQNHDQVGNRAYGDRLNRSIAPELMEALETMLMLSPNIPLIFMGEEHDETHPFRFFCDYKGKIAKLFRDNRLAEGIAFGSLSEDDKPDDLPDPNALKTFKDSKIDWKRPNSEEGKRRLDFFGALIETRLRAIVPLLAEAGGRCGKILKAKDGIIAIDWQLGQTRLELRANFGKSEAEVPPFRGKILYAHPDGTHLEGKKIGPTTVIYAMEP